MVCVTIKPPRRQGKKAERNDAIILVLRHERVQGQHACRGGLAPIPALAGYQHPTLAVRLDDGAGEEKVIPHETLVHLEREDTYPIKGDTSASRSLLELELAPEVCIEDLLLLFDR